MFWLIIGIVLLLTFIYDLFTGAVWTMRKIYRSEEPGSYWFVMAIYLVLAVSCAMPYLYWYM